MSGVRIAGVAAPTSNAFIVEILEAVTAEVRAIGGDAFVHRGTVADVDDGRTAFLIIPHEYYWFNPRPAPEHLRRTISLDVEHPGTHGFDVTSRVAQVVGAVFEISTDSVQELARRGVRAELFTIGYSERWDMWHGQDGPRSLDLTYMAAADPERVQVLAKLGPDLAGINANLLVPPYEHRISPRPDFLMGDTKWRFLADTNVLLNLHRESKTALELIRTAEAMCNGCVVLTEPSTGLGAIEPGTHILVAPRESIGREAHRVLADTELLRSVRHNAYEYCRRELSMRASAERLIAVAEDVVSRARSGGPAPRYDMPDWPEVRPPHVPELAHWVPEADPLPAAGAVLPETDRQTVGELAAHRRGHMAVNDVHTGAPAEADVDVVIVRHAASGPLANTLASVASQRVPVNVHVAGINTAMEPQLGAVNSYLTCSIETSIGTARNELIERSSAPYILVLDSGDELFEGTLRRMLARLEAAPESDLVYTMAALGEETVVNLFHPERPRLEKHAYLTRGYLIRRDSIDRLGRFAEDPEIEAYVDHELWTRVVSDPEVSALHMHIIGMRLAPTNLSMLTPFDPAHTRELLAARARERSQAEEAASWLSSVDIKSLPKISALMGAYNYGSYIVEAIESAMHQEYPPELLELIVVDDGSTDGTAELVASCVDRHPGRIRFVQQQNAGATAATNRARQEATGDIIALLDADDVWLPDKSRKQVEFMQRRPELGLVFSQMRVIDAHGATLQQHYGHREPMPVNAFARLLWENVAVQSSLIVGADLFDQIPREAPYADWWLALIAAQRKHLDYLREDLVLYRWHGANITGGVGGVKALREAQKGIQFQRWVLRSFDIGEFAGRLSAAEMAYVWTGLENQAQKGLSGLHSHFGELAAVTDEDRADACRDAEAADRALATGEFQRACALLLRARACDPYDLDLRDRFDEAVQAAEEGPSLPDPLQGHSGFTVSTDAAFLLGDDDRLRAYAEAMRTVPDAALVIDASAMDPEDASERLSALVDRCGLADDDLLMIGIVGELRPSQQLRVSRATQALYGEAAGSPNGGRPSFTPASLPALRDLAERWRTP
jgi:glycosyltransferase involved in cell wall biosynthesis